jgi:hypothetical protein
MSEVKKVDGVIYLERVKETSKKLPESRLRRRESEGAGVLTGASPEKTN